MNKFLLNGGNHVEDGKNYVKGEVVTSKLDLASLFPNKFQKVEAVSGGDGVTIVTPVIPTPKKVGTVPQKDEKIEPEAKSLQGEPAKEQPDGTEVTKDFPQAEGLNLKVMKVSPRRFNVVDLEDSTKPMNEAPMPKDKVESYLKTLEA